MNKSIWTTSLEVSQRIKELVGEQKTHFKRCGGHIWYHDDENGKYEPCDNDDLLDNDEYCNLAEMTCEFIVPVFTLSELAPVLKKIEEKIFSQRADWELTDEGCWIDFYKDICMLVGTGKEKEANQYLMELLK